jgi:hypothetical protein
VTTVFEEELKKARREHAERNGKAPGGGKGAPHAQPEPAGVPIVRTLGTVQAKPVEWEWEKWIPRGTVTLLDGDPGLGKSTLTLDLAARRSRGWPMPPLAGGVQVSEPGDVLLLSAEDDVARTILPRLVAAGADLDRVHSLDAIRVCESDADGQPVVLPLDVAPIEKVITENKVKLAIVDPFMAFLDGGLDSNKDSDVRRCLHKLKLLAEKHGIALILVRHLNKMVSVSAALYRGGGSIGIIGAARSALLVGRHPDKPQVHVLAANKCNLAAKPKSLAYTMEPAGNVARIGWMGEVDLSADDILAHPGGKKKTKVQKCIDDIRGLLSDGPMDSDALHKKLREAGYGSTTIKVAKSAIGVVTRRKGFGKDGKWVAELPKGDEEDAEGDEPEDEECSDTKAIFPDGP